MIRRAQVWTPTDVPAMDIKAGPQGKGAYAPGETITCDKTDEEGTGKSPQVLLRGRRRTTSSRSSTGSRTARSTPRSWPRGCSGPWASRWTGCTRCAWCAGDAPRIPSTIPSPAPSPVTFDPAAVERKLPGKAMESKPDSGWKWPELDLVDESRGGAPLRAPRRAEAAGGHASSTPTARRRSSGCSARRAPRTRRAGPAPSR